MHGTTGQPLDAPTLQRRLALLVGQGRNQMLGDARAVRYVCALQANTRFAFMIDLSWASSQLEGNTYSRLDTAL